MKLYRTTPARATGIGWIAVEEYNTTKGEYSHIATFRSQHEALCFIEREISREKETTS